MANQIAAGPELLEYVREFSLREDDILRDLRLLTVGLPGGEAMQVMAEEGQFLAFLIAATGVTDVLEIGTFTGYSTLCMARALPAEGRLITCDITERWPEIGAEHWRRAGVAERIDVRIGAAVDTLEKMLAAGFADHFGLVFIDADKVNYPRYYELALRLVRPGGVVVVDNTLFFGRVVDPLAVDADTAGVRALNAVVRDDERVDVSMLPVADGITLVRRR
ncbi:class I SAM-dependent methyltransferase [Streptomyces griseoviridis]|uniref:SAM-dependent methyltransferase n=1 Tax=Streptomyces griseoviridis TaxID=45398 RepID=A0A3S9ZPK5_STRGD|nr:class I SAM-dependent methyltransferase [Streptomyces griseoviridis]AZS89532.1 SAM-dependent methyltransferase [Streptomyces griseoviridis]QCN90305.1 SAM-dependent methyltransferase [Streptomyces griseoviridis]